MTLLLFAYGSLVSPGSAARSLGFRPLAADGPVPAVLRGYRREWNVGSDRRSHPERRLLTAEGHPFTGTLAVLGLAPDPAAECTGALYRLAPSDVEALRERERNYDVLDVTGNVPAAEDRLRGARVVTWLPRPEPLRRLAAAREAGRAVVRRGYARLVVAAFDALGPGRLAGYLRTTRPHGLPERDIRVG